MGKKMIRFTQTVCSITVTVLGLILKSRWGAWAWTIVALGGALTVISLIGLIAAQFGGGAREEQKELPQYRRKKAVLTAVEADFLAVLKWVVDGRCELLMQVPLLAVIDKVTQNSYRNELFRIVDFALIDGATYAPLVLIELNDASHKRADRVERDRKVAEICDRAKLPLVTFDLQQATDRGYVKKQLSRYIR